MAVRFAPRPARPAGSAVDFSARAGRHLLLRFLFSPVSDQGIDRPGRHPAGTAVSGGDGRPTGRLAVLVRADALLDFGQLDGPDDDHVDRADRVGDCLPESLATAEFLHLLFVFSFVRRRHAEYFRATSQTACCWKRVSWRFYLRRPACCRDGARTIRLCVQAGSCCSGSGSASTSNRAW